MNFLFFGLIFLAQTLIISCQNDKIKATDIKNLTLRAGQLTTGRRLAPIQQLTCINGTAGCTRQPNTVQCFNRGTNGTTIKWECTAALDKSVKFGTIKISCEGYDSSNDTYVLAGSCGLRYSLEYNISDIVSKAGKVVVGLVITFLVLIIGGICACLICCYCCCKKKGSSSVTKTPGVKNNPTPHYSSSSSKHNYSGGSSENSGSTYEASATGDSETR